MAGQNPRAVTFGAGRDDVDPLPAIVNAEGLVVTEWQPDAEELERLAAGVPIRLWIFTYGHPLQPVALEVPADISVRST